MRRQRRAFSLIELILAIGLSIALVALIGFAIDLHVLRLDSSRSTIEQAQLARAILNHIATDLRSVTTAPSQDVSELMAAAESSAQFDVDEVDLSASQSTDDTDAVASEDEGAVGINGTIDSITIDARLIRQTLATPAEGGTPVARVGAWWTQVAYGMSLVQDAPGLVRSETYHDTVRWRNEQGQVAPAAAPIAPEVRSLSFRYFDGTQMVDLWDMQEQGALPAAVEVKIELAPADEAGDLNTTTVLQTPKAYRRLVRLPAAAEETEADDASGSADASDMEGV